MSIFTFITDNNPMNQVILANSQDSETTQSPKEQIKTDFCLCNYLCKYENVVFAELEGNEDYKNDKTSFLFSVSSSTSTFEIILIDSSGNEEIINDNSFGEYFPLGSFNQQKDQEKYVGFICDWQKVFQVKGAGVYFFKFKENSFGSEVINESVIYRLQPFSEVIASKTVRFRFIQKGTIQNSLDYNGIDWTYEIRLKAKLNYSEPTFEQTDFLKGDRVVEQIQDSKIENIEIEVDFVPSVIGDFITDIGILSNNILVTNYGLADYKKYVDFDIIIKELTDLKANYEFNNLASFKLPSLGRNQSTVKRN